MNTHDDNCDCPECITMPEETPLVWQIIGGLMTFSVGVMVGWMLWG